MHRFYVPNFSTAREIALPKEEAQHLSRVLRLRVGDLVAVFDGRGHEALASVSSIAAGRVGVNIVEPRTPAEEPRVAITLAQGLLKGDKMDGVIRDAVMLGVAAIQPFLSDRTDVPNAALKGGRRQERWDRTVIASAKQCGRAVVPPVRPVVEFRDLLESSGGKTRVMFVEPTVRAEVSEPSALEAERPPDVTVLIGPEGGWAPEEIDASVAAGVHLVSLGRLVLRADSAGALAIALLRYMWRDL